jgi:hypothetical protein
MIQIAKIVADLRAEGHLRLVVYPRRTAQIWAERL